MMTDILLIVNIRIEDFPYMARSQARKADSHERIVGVAAARFREAGIDGVGVADLMNDAGLTHGGFYRHFSSRDELVTEAVEHALREGGQVVLAFERALNEPHNGDREAEAGRRRAILAKLVDGYLSITHRDELAKSCAVTTLAGDVARSNEDTRAAYTRQASAYLELFTKLIADDKHKARRMKAIVALSTLVGAVSMARAVNDEKLSREILTSAADELKAHLHATALTADDGARRSLDGGTPKA
jgi:TetR/AcrR family transcriptional repressor of nem operon